MINDDFDRNYYYIRLPDLSVCVCAMSFGVYLNVVNSPNGQDLCVAYCVHRRHIKSCLRLMRSLSLSFTHSSCKHKKSLERVSVFVHVLY